VAQGCSEFVSLAGRPLFAYTTPLQSELKSAALLTVFLDASMMAGTAGRVWRNALIFVVPQVLLIVVITYFVMQSAVLARHRLQPLNARSVRAPSRRAPSGRKPPRRFRRGEPRANLASAKASAETEARLRETADSLWTPSGCGSGCRNACAAHVSSCPTHPPGEHVRRGRNIQAWCGERGRHARAGAGGCDGMGRARLRRRGSRVVDARGRVRVPPDRARYTLRRVWLFDEEEGYRFGFANQGLWPLCPSRTPVRSSV
jgi:trehalose 6-phosphate synthase